jgi:hypothetical protein
VSAKFPIENDIEEGMESSKPGSTAHAIYCLALTVSSVAHQIRNLGFADAMTPMGALEGLGLMVKESAERIADAIALVEKRE